jgi:hypothetical protein
MFETVIAAMLKHKQIVFAAIAVTALIGYIAPPAVQVAQAQSFGESLVDSILGTDDTNGDDDVTEEDNDDNQEIDQDLDQENDQDADQNEEATQTVNQPNDQSEEANQANVFETGDNAASASQDNDNEQTVASEATAAAESATAGGDGGSDNDKCCDHHDGKKSKHHDGKDDCCGSSSGGNGGDAASDTDATAVSTATGTQDNDNAITQNLDSSIHDVTATNTANFGDDTNRPVAIPIIDQDQDIDQRAANLAAQLGVNFDFESGFTNTGFTNTDD